ncbi:VOC family protein [Azospirillum sp. ST 5-10]|uniref:VOC family protein n=1 Tax=unclassified Azospirillum TaxID=2630922 RepID=UPI003F4A4867
MPVIPARLTGIDHVVLRVADVDRTVAFYTDVLGLTLERIYERIGLHQLRCGRNLIDIVPMGGDGLAAPEARGIDHLCLNLDGDLDAVIAALREAGIEPSLGPMEVYGARGFGTSVYIRDPDGYEIELKAGYARRPVRFP